MARQYRDPSSYEVLCRHYHGTRRPVPLPFHAPVRRGWSSNAPAANTFVRYASDLKDEGPVCLRFYSTDLFTLYPAGWGVLHVGSGTATTRERLRRFLPEHVALVSGRGGWMLNLGPAAPDMPYLPLPAGGCFLPPRDLLLPRHVYALIASAAPLAVLADALDDIGAGEQLTAEMRLCSLAPSETCNG